MFVALLLGMNFSIKERFLSGFGLAVLKLNSDDSTDGCAPPVEHCFRGKQMRIDLILA